MTLTNAIAKPFFATLFLTLGLSSNAQAAIFTFTRSADFFDTLDTAPRLTETFEGVPSDTIISPGTTLNGITYQSFNGTLAGRIDGNFNRFGNGSLAAERDGDLATIDFFNAGESFSISFAQPVYAVGIFFNASPTFNNSDFYIETSVGIAITGGDISNYDIDTFFFAGLVSDTPFTTATIGSQSSGSSYNVDNLTYATSAESVPEPATILGSLIVGSIIATKNQRQKRR
ncbi:PEP-CTERM sorting domain-containing protein [Merismopedia glauca]|uniref:PEP-CTERM sorting domain-containing protein n=1 Tax=Merismopedia glauca CCAP 1448/3 TaxID=1296344 RepID=A0A2T1C8J4_9CYAN|nr:PEP-CTERM sorting domain-containing protein [Merismopedia glauca]PSB04590.1 hypothetical protein C7B64_03295 [Merismopedia glauca CCAP 1448/3]